MADGQASEARGGAGMLTGPQAIEELRAALKECAGLLRDIDNGPEYGPRDQCRACDAGSHNNWSHSAACWIAEYDARAHAAKLRARDVLNRTEQ